MDGTIELGFTALTLLLGVWFLLSFGIGIFAAFMLLRGPADGVYQGKVVMHGLVKGKSIYKHRVSDTGRTFPETVLNVTFKSRLHGWTVLQVEDESPLREALDDSGVGDVWRIRLSRIKKRSRVTRKHKSISWLDTDMAAKFGGQQRKINE